MTSLADEKKVPFYAGLLICTWLLGLAGESFYSPVMPTIATHFATTDTLVKLTITFFIFGKTISMLICSPIAEAFGRRQFILVGLFLFILGGMLCMLSPNIYTLLSGRLIQGIGCSITILMGRAVVNDSFPNKYAAKVFSYIFTGNAIGIFLLPILGGYMATYLNWRCMFLLLVAYGGIILVIMWWFLPQTNLKSNLSSLKPAVIINNYKALIMNKPFWGFLLCIAFMMGGEKAYTTGSAFLFINNTGLTRVNYGYLTAMMWGAHLVGTLLAGRLAFKLDIDRTLTIGVSLIAVAALSMLGMCWLNENQIYTFVPAMLIYMLGTGFIIVTAAVGIIRPFPRLIGFATAFAMVFEFIIASITSLIISAHPSSFISVEKWVGIMGILTLFSWFFLLVCKFPMLLQMQRFKHRTL